MDLNIILKEIQTKIAENESGVSVYREDFVPSNLGSKRETGYIAWSFSMDYMVENSEYLTGTIEGDLDVICYARSRSTRGTLHTNVMDLWMPLYNGRRQSLGPVPLGGAYLHFVNLEDISELFTEKTGHQESETPGIIVTFRIKIST